MIASVARQSGRSVESVGADSYALTLWAFLHGKDAERLDALVREAESNDLAEMVACAFHEPKKLSLFRSQFRAKLGVARTREEIERAANELAERHARQLARNPVS